MFNKTLREVILLFAILTMFLNCEKAAVNQSIESMHTISFRNILVKISVKTGEDAKIKLLIRPVAAIREAASVSWAPKARDMKFPVP